MIYMPTTDVQLIWNEFPNKKIPLEFKIQKQFQQNMETEPRELLPVS